MARKILLVDDEAGFTELLKMTLERSGAFEVRIENDSTKAVAAARNFMPLNTLVGAEYRAFAQAVDDRLKQLWQVRPWRG